MRKKSNSHNLKEGPTHHHSVPLSPKKQQTTRQGSSRNGTISLTNHPTSSVSASGSPSPPSTSLFSVLSPHPPTVAGMPNKRGKQSSPGLARKGTPQTELRLDSPVSMSSPSGNININAVSSAFRTPPATAHGTGGASSLLLASSKHYSLPTDPLEDLNTELAIIVDPNFPAQRNSHDETNNNLSLTRLSSGWRYVAPPVNQRTFFFPEDNIEFSSEFDSGNLIQMERLGPFRYNAYTAMDCANTPEQTNNRQWFHFSVRGGYKGVVISITMVSMMHSKMYTFEWTPVMAIRPQRPQYQRLTGKAVVISQDTMPPTPGFPQMVYKKREDLENSLELPLEGDDEADMTAGGSSCYSLPPLSSIGKPLRRRKKKDISMSLSFEFRLETDVPLKSNFPLGHPNCNAVYIASNHPYPYETLQRNLSTWEIQAQRKPTASSYVNSMPYTQCAPIFFHREVLCKTLDHNNVDLITITDTTSMLSETMPLMCSQLGIPYSSAHGNTKRPPKFANKLYAVLTARVHPGECPASHTMHGCIEFLLSRTDPRAAALRQKFVFMIVPMINPDGVVRGHSRADSCGVDLNRMYRNPCFFKHPAPYCIRMLLNILASEKKLALYIDMHAHANKKGTFFYGNSMNSAHQLQALLYAKLVQLNTPYFEFFNCNFTESNMFATGKAGKGKDNSSRVVVYLDTGFPLSFTIEASHVAGKSFTPIAVIPGFTDETQDTQANVANVRYSPLTFADTGRGLLLALLDMKGLNPLSRIPMTMFHSVRGVTLWLQRQLQVEVAERLFVQAYKSGIRADLTDPTTVVSNVMATLSQEDVPDKMTLRNARSLPPLTLNGLKEFFCLDSAASILAQTPPAGPPRSLLCGVTQRRVGTSMPAVLPTKPLGFPDYQAGQGA